jgi:hypothetical protein
MSGSHEDEKHPEIAGFFEACAVFFWFDRARTFNVPAVDRTKYNP